MFCSFAVEYDNTNFKKKSLALLSKKYKKSSATINNWEALLFLYKYCVENL
jgi:hypothetical protein